MPKVQLPAVTPKRRAWNKGRLVGQKRPLLPKQVWAIRARLELAGNLRDLALFNVAIDSKLRGCDLVSLKITDLIRDDRVRERVSVVQSKTNKPVQFELAENTRETVTSWIKSPEMMGCQFMFPSRFHDHPHISTRQYGRLVRDWVVSIGLEPSGYGTHSMRRTKVAEIYRKTGNLRAVQLLLGHTKVDSIRLDQGEFCDHSRSASTNGRSHSSPRSGRGCLTLPTAVPSPIWSLHICAARTCDAKHSA